jgi:hypothetical protein
MGACMGARYALSRLVLTQLPMNCCLRCGEESRSRGRSTTSKQEEVRGARYALSRLVTRAHGGPLPVGASDTSGWCRRGTETEVDALLWPGDSALEACSRATLDDLPISEARRDPGTVRPRR